MEQDFKSTRKAGFPLRFILLPLLLLAVDQGAKLLVTANLKLGQEVILLPGLFNLTYVQNAGAALGIFGNMTVFLVGISSLMVVLLYVLAWRDYQEGHPVLPELLIIGGAFGNLVDRIFLGGRVRDFLEVPFFAVMNLADWFVSAGILLLVLKYFLAARKPVLDHDSAMGSLENEEGPEKDGAEDDGRNE